MDFQKQVLQVHSYLLLCILSIVIIAVMMIVSIKVNVALHESQMSLTVREMVMSYLTSQYSSYGSIVKSYCQNLKNNFVAYCGMYPAEEDYMCRTKEADDYYNDCLTKTTKEQLALFYEVVD